MIRNALLGALMAVCACSGALAQSSPGWDYGQVPTAGQMNNAFSLKQDVLNFTPLNNAGGTMLGKLILAPSSTGFAGLNFGQGVAPTSPQNGDMWLTTAGLFAEINGVATGPFVVASGTATWPGLQTFGNINVTGGIVGGVGTTVVGHFENGLLTASNPTFQGVLSITNPTTPYLYWAGTANAAGQIAWNMNVDTLGTFHFQKENDAGNAFADVFTVGSSGQTLGNLTWFDGTIVSSGGWTFAASVIAPAGVMPTIAGGGLAGSALTLEGTYNGSPSGDVVNLNSGGSTIARAQNTGFVIPAFAAAGVVENSAAGLLSTAPTLSGALGGTGVANTGKTITLGGNLTTSGAFATTLTSSATTNSTLPAGTHSLAPLDSPTFTGTAAAPTVNATTGFSANGTPGVSKTCGATIVVTEGIITSC